MDLALDSSYDLVLDGGELQLVTGTEAIVQHLRVRLNMVLGEWFLDRRLGVPWFEHVLVKNPNPVLVRSIIREVMLGTPGIDSIEELRTSLDTATRTLSVEASLTSGQVSVPFTFRESPLEAA